MTMNVTKGENNCFRDVTKVCLLSAATSITLFILLSIQT